MVEQVKKVDFTFTADEMGSDYDDEFHAASRFALHELELVDGEMFVDVFTIDEEVE